MDSDKLFSEVKFFMAQCNRHDEIKDSLIEGGARHINYLSEQVTHVIADSNCPEAEEAVDLYDKPVVTSLWVHLCIKAKRLLPSSAFSPNRKIFHNVIAAFSGELSSSDIDVLAATLTFYGGCLTKNLQHATHFIATSTKPSEIQAEPVTTHKFKMIAPDWILDSVKQSCLLEESPYEPGLLLGPPPPPPPKLPTPPPIVTTEEVSDNNIKQTDPNVGSRPSIVPSSNGGSERDMIVTTQNKSPSTMTQQRLQHHPQPHLNQTQPPRMRMASNVPRGAQPRFRQILPPNTPQGPRHPMQAQSRMIMIDPQQPRRMPVDQNQTYRKMGPYQPVQDIQQVQPMGPMPHQLQSQQQQHMPPQQMHSYQQAPHPPMQHPNSLPNQTNRMPRPNMYQQARPPYQSNQIPSRMNVPQPNMMNQQQMQSQPINRYQDPSGQMSQPRPYQVGMQHQGVGPGYQPNNPQRQPVYYNQNQTMPMRMPQQGVPPRMMVQNDHIPHENFPQPADNMPPHPQYQPAPQQVYQQQPRQQIQPQHRPQQFQQPHPPVMMQARPQFQPTMPNAVRGPRGQMSNQHETKSGPRQPVDKPPRAPRASLIRAQPHPSIFDPKQESSYAQMKAKVPILTDNIEYFDQNPGFAVPKYQPFLNCVFKLVEHTSINPKLIGKWTDAIMDAGGKFSDDTEELTHIICESRSTPIFMDAMKKSIRCVTIYWINDCLAQDRMTYPWKALHIPTPFLQDDKPLQSQIVSITNFKGRERREVKEMVLKTGAKCTDYFSQSNTLLICGSPGGEKYEKAIEWSIPIANCQLLSDFLISGRDFSQMLAHAKYQNFNRGDQLKLDSYVLIRDLMHSWTKPVPLPMIKKVENSNSMNGIVKKESIVNNNEDSGLATGGSNNSDTEPVKSVLDSQPTSTGEELKLKEESITASERSFVDGQQIEQLPSAESSSISSNIDLKPKIENNDVDMKVADACLTQEANVPTETTEKSVALIETSDSVDQSGKAGTSLSQSEAGRDSNNDLDTINKANVKPVRKSDEPISILFTHFQAKLLRQLEAHAQFLGLSLAGSPVDCTHLVVSEISRTPKFICAFSHAKFILSYKWLEESHEAGQVLDEKAYILQDSEGEKKFSFSLIYSLLKRKRRKSLLFTDFIFFVTPTVLSVVKNLKEMIESAGGKITTRKLPTVAQLNQIRTSGKRFVVITNQQDLHLCTSAEQIGVDLLRVEFVISGILRQDIDIEAHRLCPRRPVRSATETQVKNSIVAPSPNKKLRAE